MEDSLLADLLVGLDIINGHDVDGATFGIYSLKPMSMMSYIAQEIVFFPVVQEGYQLRMSHKDDKYIVAVEKAWVTVEHEDLHRATIEACARALGGLRSES